MDIFEEKNNLRKIFIEKRKQIDFTKQQDLSQQIARNFQLMVMDKNIDFKCQIIGSYMPTKYEAKPIFIEEFLLKNNCELCFPRIDDYENLLDFKLTKEKNNFIFNNKYKKIQEPPKSNDIIIPDIVLVPLLSFDASLNRLGMGQGFYDRTIRNLKSKNPKLITIGIAFDFQQSLQGLPNNKSDSSLDFIVSNSRYYS
jgi:5-formyltetrahydrofolate cyclo-ligase